MTRAPRLPLDEEDVNPEGFARVQLPEGTIVATARRLAEGRDDLAALEGTAGAGDVGLYRVTRGGEVPVYGPDDPAEMATALAELDEATGGLALVDGSWERRAFAAPEVVQGVILVVGSGYSGKPERSAAALSFVADTLGVPRCDAAAEAAWRRAVVEDLAFALDAQGRVLDGLRVDHGNPAVRLGRMGPDVRALALPGKATDALLASLVRGKARCALVVKDPTWIHVAPIYHKAWLKGGGSFTVVETMRLLAVATNPTNPQGPDADPDRFRNLVTERLAGVPVHDVRLEATDTERRPVWKFWS